MITIAENVTLNINSETAPLQAVVVGLAQDIGPNRYRNNPKMAYHIEHGTFPTEANLVAEIEQFVALLQQQGVQVYRPQNLPGLMQIFTRDIAFVVGQQMVRASMRLENRRGEFAQLRAVLAELVPGELLEPPAGAFVEGGDVLLHGDYIFVGVGARTNEAGYQFLRRSFPHKEVISLPLQVSDDPCTHILHLDCAFQPVGHAQAILFPQGFQQRPDALYDIFGAANLITVSGPEMYQMVPNIFSISPQTIVSERQFSRLNQLLRHRGFMVLETPYAEVSKLGGLLRCSTLPLHRA